jgi:secretion/DNA translocation related TadE-like protein
VRRPAQRGSVTVLLAAAMSIALVLAVGLADLGRVLRARGHARAAADAGALAAAQELAFPSGADPAVAAADYVGRNDAPLVSCACSAGTFEAIVEVSVEVGDLWLLPASPSVVQRSRAVVDIPAG